MKTKFMELAEIFGVRLGDIADAMGVTRQCLHGLEKQKINPKAMHTKLNSLRYVSEKMFEEDVAQANEEKKRRKAAIDSLAIYFGGSEKDD